MTPLTRPVRGPFCAQVGPVCSAGIVTRIFKGNAFSGGLREVFAPAGRAQRSKRIGKTSGAVRHAVQRVFARALTDPAAAAFRPKPGVRKQMLSTSDRSIENFGRVGVAIKTKQSEYAAGAPADRIQLSVRRDQFVGEQSSRDISVRKQIVPIKQFRR